MEYSESTHPAGGDPTAMASYRVRVDQAGRLVVPAAIRKVLGIRTGEVLTVEVDEGCIKLRTVHARLERFWAIAEGYPAPSGSVVDAFIADRRAEAAREGAGDGGREEREARAGVDSAEDGSEGVE